MVSLYEEMRNATKNYLREETRKGLLLKAVDDVICGLHCDLVEVQGEFYINIKPMEYGEGMG